MVKMDQVRNNEASLKYYIGTIHSVLMCFYIRLGFKRAHKGGSSVGRRLEILRNVWHRLGNETVSVGLKWSVKCRATKSECRCRATLILG